MKIKLKKTDIGASQQQRPTTENGNVAAAGTAALQERKPDEYRVIPRKDIFPDPDQPRKTFTEASIDEMALTQVEQGIVQALVVRLVPAAFKVQEPDLHSKVYALLKRNGDKWDACDECDEKNYKLLKGAWAGHFGGRGDEGDYVDRFVIVFGERRWRGAAPRKIKTDAGVVDWKGLDELPCLVRDVEGHRVFAQQFIENEQRENISALEEATALQKQVDARRQAAGGGSFSIEGFAAELGMSRAGLYARLALNRLHPPVREALLAGKISTSVAAAVAVIPLPKQQEQALVTITNEHDWKFPYSVREVQELVSNVYCQQLSEAPFDLDESFEGRLIVDDQMAPTCQGCRFRTGNMLDEFPELKARPNACTRPDCYAKKCKVTFLAKAENARERGKTVLTPAEFGKVKDEYVRADKETNATYHLFEGVYGEAPAKVLGKHAPEPVIVATSKGLEKYFKKEELPAAAKKAKVKLASGRGGDAALTAEQKTENERKQKEEEEKWQRLTAFVFTLLPRLAKGIEAVKEKAAWAMLAGQVEERKWMKERARLLVAVKSDQAQVLVDAMWHDLDAVFENRKPEKKTLELFQTFGIDLMAEFAEAEKVAQKEMAMTTKKAPEQGNLIEVKKNKKKGGGKTLPPLARAKIAAQARARWAKIRAKK